MLDGLLILMGGLLGSAHCAGMCGGFVLTLGAAQRSAFANLGRQTVYALGRVCTYSLFGAAVGYGAWRLDRELTSVAGAQALLSIVAGVLLAVVGLVSAGVLRWAYRGEGGCPGAAALAGMLRARGLGQVFAAGVLNGLLPCGLVYAYLALAGSSGDMLRGALTMALFGLGTAPAMVLMGLGGSVLSVGCRRRIFRVAAWCMVVSGVLAMLRGLGFLQLGGLLAGPACPFCP